MLLLVAAAWAHFPHDVAAWLAIPPDRSFVATSLWRTEAWMVARTSNLEDVDVRFLADGADELRAAVAVSDTRLLFGGIGHGLLVSDDGGDSATASTALTVDVYDLELVGTRVYAATVDGLRGSDDGGDTWTEVLPGAFVDVDGDADGDVCALAADGGLWCDGDDGFTELVVEPGEPWMVAVEPDAVYVAAGSAGLVDRTGAPVGVDGFPAHVDVTLVAAEAGTLFVAGANEALFWRRDGVWSETKAGLDVPVDGGDGSPRDGNHYFEVRRDADGLTWLASWEGLAWADDTLDTWHAVQIDGQTTHRGAAWSTTDDGVGTLLLASYGGGVYREAGDLSDAAVLSADVDMYYPRTVAVDADWSEDAAILFAHTQAYLSTDAGATWTLVRPLSNVQRVAFPRGGPWVAVGGESGQLAVAVSDDGVAWTVPAVPACGGEAGALALSPDFSADRMFYVGCSVDGLVARSTDAGATVTTFGTAGTHVWSLAATGATVLAGTDDGLWAWDGAAFVQVAFAGRIVHALARSPDPAADAAVYAVVLGEGLWRSDDGGATWAQLPQPTAQLVVSTAVSPDFATDHVVTCSGYGGTWLSRDRGDTWTWANLVEHHEPVSPYWTWVSGWDVTDQEAASTGTATAQLRFRGVGVDVHGTVEGAGFVTGTVDAGEPIVLSGDGTVARWTGLDDAWHTLELYADGATVRVDDADVWRQAPTGGAADSDTAVHDTDGGRRGAPDGDRCGCGPASGPAGSVAGLVGVLGVVSRRRPGSGTRRDRARAR